MNLIRATRVKLPIVHYIAKRKVNVQVQRVQLDMLNQTKALNMRMDSLHENMNTTNKSLNKIENIVSVISFQLSVLIMLETIKMVTH